MKVLLTQPLTRHVKHAPNIPDLGLGYLAAALRNSGHQPLVLDWNMRCDERGFKDFLLSERPGLVGVKIFTKDVKAAQITVSLIREALPHAAIVIGGPHPSALEAPDLMDDFQGADFAIRGEAETSLPALASALQNRPDKSAPLINPAHIRGIAGLVWRDGGRVRSNPISFVHKLDEIGFPAWDLIDPGDYSATVLGVDMKEGRSAPVIMTRGCPAHCTFCTAFNVNGRAIRTRSPENVFEEMKLLYSRYNVRTFMFQDNCFTSGKKNLLSLCDMIIRGDLRMEWDCVSYESLSSLDNDTVPLMYKAGCRMIHMGIEAGCESTRKRIHKGGSLKEIAQKAALVKSHGVRVGAWFMLGFPEETFREMLATVRYAFSLKADLVTFTPCFPLPGTEVYEYTRRKYALKKIDWALFDIDRSSYSMSRISSSQLRAFIKLLRFRLRAARLMKLVGLS